MTDRARRAARLVGKTLGGALEILLPAPCALCGRATSPGADPVCEVCFARLPRIDPPRCGRCGATCLGRPPETRRCRECAGWPDHLARASSPFRMEGDAARLVRALKFERCFALAPRMGRAMARSARSIAGGREHVLVPVPLGPARLRERGFNQAELLARSLADALKWPWAPLLERVRDGPPQARLGGPGRRGNVTGAFRARPPKRGSSLRPLLVDDVITTGATAAACASVLAEGGEPPTGVVSFARALRPVPAR